MVYWGEAVNPLPSAVVSGAVSQLLRGFYTFMILSLTLAFQWSLMTVQLTFVIHRTR